MCLQNTHWSWRLQAESARMAAEEMQAAAEATAHQVEAEQRILRLHASLSAAEESAGAALLVRSNMGMASHIPFHLLITPGGVS